MYSDGRDYGIISEALLDTLIKDENISGDVLDIGCGTGDLAVKLARRGMNVVGVDFSAVAIKKARARAVTEGVSATFIEGDISVINDTFDAIFCKLVYAFISDKELFLKEVKARLKEGGVFVLITPILNTHNKDTEKKPGICATEEDIKTLMKVFPATKEYHTDYGEEGRIIKTFLCRV